MDEYGVDEAPQVEGSESNAALMQLQDAFVSALTASGTLGKIRAQLRATALALLRGDDDLQNAAVGSFIRPLTLTTHAKVSLLLLYDFLEHHHLRQTAGVFDVESSVHLLLEERTSLLAELARLPGEGSLLERLLQSHEQATQVSSASPPHVSTPPTASKETSGISAVESSTSPVCFESSLGALEKAAPAAQPEDADVQYELNKYEDSIPFSDADGTIDANMQCDEVERLTQ
ncbi:hypothetical protein JKF63_02019 [Porcisia hertigi]|uniref:LisH domain-containing protein n=1 Tax=Porcisia hertigi TaxID=2761500 RepID=A0A836H7A4_9TRYP|nr:hypothetical protein JKF63_02019 [Porcisia hertigi]